MIKIIVAIRLILLGVLISGPWRVLARKLSEWKKEKATKNIDTHKQIDVQDVQTQKDPQEVGSIHERIQTRRKEKVVEEKKTNETQKDTTIEKTNNTKNIETTKKKEIEEEENKVRMSPKEIKALKELKYAAITYRERKKRDEYEKKLIEGLALDPENLDFLEMLSGYYFDTGSYVKAMTLLKKLVNKHPKHHKAIRQIGQVYIHQNDLDTAKILIEKAITMKTDDPKYFISLVDIHYTKNDLKEAIKAMEKILKLRPTNSDYLMGMATLHEESAQPTKAYHYYSKVIELDPMHEHAKQGLKRLGGRG